jgi:16S rRNA (uracil1498-N3)-methyltransferase
MPRFFVDPTELSGDTVTLSGDVHRHISLSLRMAVGDTLILSDGEGFEADGRILAMSGSETTVALSARRTGEAELPLSVHLYQGNPKGDKSELILQKATELGAASVTFFESSRTVARVVPERAEKQRTRLVRIATEAAGQCGRARIPRVTLPLSFEAALAEAKKTCDLVLFCYEAQKEGALLSVLEEAKDAGVKSIAVFVGPEGGFSESEAAVAVASGARAVMLGRRILRCETAPIYAISCIGAYFEK